mgnify:CR=1 FL=1
MKKRGEVHVNQAARAMLGLPDNEPVTTTFLKDKLGFYPFDLVAAGGGPVREEVRMGEALYHSVVSTVLDDAGAPCGAWLDSCAARPPLPHPRWLAPTPSHQQPSRQ